MVTTCAPATEALTAGALHAAAAHHHLQQLADADGRLSGVDADALARLIAEVGGLATCWAEMAEMERRQELLRRLDLESGI